MVNTGYVAVGIAMAAALASVSGCSNSDSAGSVTVQLLAVPGVTNSVAYSFDIGASDGTRYYVTDRTNKSIDVIDWSVDAIEFVPGRTPDLVDWSDLGPNFNQRAVAQFKVGFAGCNTVNATGTVTAVPSCQNADGTPLPGSANDTSGPDSLNIVGDNLYIGDVNKMWVLNKSTGAVVASVAIPSNPTFLRADGGCFDPDDNIFAIATPGDVNPFMTFIDTTTYTVIAKVVMNGSDGVNSAGLEACVYDKATKKFFVINDGSTANPNGEMNVIPAAAIVALKAGAPQTVGIGTGGWEAAVGGSIYPLPALCDPTGIALGPNNEIGAMCRPGTVGTPLNFYILDKTNGNLLATVHAGGGDQITYNATSNKWYLADSRWTNDGKSCGNSASAACPYTPKLGVVDGTTHTVTMIASGNNAHSVAVGGGLVFMPFNKPSGTAGGIAVYTGI